MCRRRRKKEKEDILDGGRWSLKKKALTKNHRYNGTISGGDGVIRQIDNMVSQPRFLFCFC